MESAGRERAARRRALGGIAVLVVLAAGWSLVFVGGLGASQLSPAAPHVGTVTAAADAGRSLYLQSCASCHGAQGAGTTSGPAITDAGAALADFMLRTGRMPLAAPGAPEQRGTPAFDDAQIDALVGYVASLGQGPPIPNVVTEGADLTRGRDLFVSNCSACHGPSGGGGSVGGGFVAPGLAQADPTTIGEAVETGPGAMPRFSFQPSDLNALAAYVSYLRDAPHPGGIAPPQVGPVTEGFVAGIALILLLLVARFVGIRVGSDQPPSGSTADAPSEAEGSPPPAGTTR
jgi:ubiquinol-cytochrome c reductase cytochrome c subunit